MEHVIGSDSGRRSAFESRHVTVSLQRLAVVALAIVFPLVLVLIHRGMIAPHFSYLGAIYVSPSSSGSFLLGLAFAAIPATFLPLIALRPSDVFLWVLYLLLYVPSAIIPTVSTTLDGNSRFLANVVLLAGLMIVRAFGRFPLVKIANPSSNARTFWFAIASISAVSYALIFYQYGFRISVPNLGDAYDLRDEYREATASGSTLVVYALFWQSKVINPLMITIGFIQKRIWLIVVGIVGQFTIYSVSGLRAVLFSALILAGILWCYGRTGQRFGPRVQLAILMLVVLAASADRVMDSVTLTSLFVRRLIVTPGLLMGQYFDFFSFNQLVYLSNSVLAPFFDYPYDRAYPFEIGAWVTGNSEMFLNAGVWTDAYANFGLLGILAFSIFLGFVLWVIDSVSLGRDIRIVFGVSGLAAWSLVNSAFFTAMLTHGVVLLIGLILLLPGAEATSTESGGKKSSRKSPSNLNPLQKGLGR